MKNKKTISHLNSKTWYKPVKVIFIIFILIYAVLFVFFAVEISKPKQVKDYKIECVSDYTNKKSFFAEKDAGMYIYQSGTDSIYQSLSIDDRKKIRESCDISDAEVNTYNSKAVDYIKQQENIGVDDVTIQKYIDNDMRPYRISEAYVTKGKYIETIIYSLLSLLIVLVVAEMMRRVFYCIFLGKINPEK